MNNIYGFDIEAIPLQLFHPEAKLLCASIAQEFVVSYVRDHPQRKYIDEEYNLSSLAIIGTILKDKNNILVGHNIQFDITGWERFYRGQEAHARIGASPAIHAQLFDTLIAHYLVSHEADEKNNLDTVAHKYLGLTKLDIKPKEIYSTPIDKLVLYNAIDSMLVYKLYNPLMNELVDNGYETLFKYLMKILKILIDMQIRGVTLDIEYIRKHRQECEEKIEELETQLIFAFGDINFGSYKQLGKVLYEQFELPILRYSDKGNPSTNVDAIIALKNSEQVPELQRKDLQSLLDYRKLKKIHSTYLDPLENKQLGYDGKIHTSYFLGKGWDHGTSFGTASGRTSSNNPNLQNQPNTVTIDNFTINVRKCFIPSEGYKIYKADYSQIEMRVGAYLSNDSRMLQVFKDGIDIHTYSLTGVYEEDYDFISRKLEEEDKEWKRRRLLIKNFNFALIYGASPFKLQMMLLKQLEIDMHLDEVRRIYNKWNKMYAKLTRWKYAIYDIIKHEGHVISETGRRRDFFPEGDSKYYPDKILAQFFREGLNHLIQSFAGDIALFGLMYLHNNLKKNKLGYPLLLVHDSMDGELKENVEIDERIFYDAMITKPKKLLQQEFDINTDKLYLDIDVKTNLDSWGE